MADNKKATKKSDLKKVAGGGDPQIYSEPFHRNISKDDPSNSLSSSGSFAPTGPKGKNAPSINPDS